MVTTWTYTLGDADRLGVHSTSRGALADELRRWLADTTPAQAQAWYADSLSTHAVALGPLRITHGDGVVIEESYALVDAWVPGADVESLELYPAGLANELPLPASVGRQHPLALPAGRVHTERVVVTAPSDHALPRSDLALQTPWFTVSTDSAPGRVEWRLEVVADRVEPGDLPAYMDAVDALQAGTALVVRRPRAARPRLGRAVLGSIGGAVFLLVGVGAFLIGRRVR